MLLGELGQALYERAKEERGEAGKATRQGFLTRAREKFEQVLELDPENMAAHYNLSLILADIGDAAGAEKHRKLHEKYKPDDNARDRAVARARLANPAANHAAEAVVIYDLQRPDAFELPPEEVPPPGGSGAGGGSGGR